MSEFLSAFVSLGFTPQNIILLVFCIQLSRLIRKVEITSAKIFQKMDRRLTRLELKDQIKEAQHGD